MCDSNVGFVWSVPKSILFMDSVCLLSWVIRGVSFTFVRRAMSRFARRHISPNRPKANGLTQVVLVRQFIRGSYVYVHITRRLSTFTSFLIIIYYVTTRSSARQPSVSRASVQTTSAFTYLTLRGVEVYVTRCRLTNIRMS